LDRFDDDDYKLNMFFMIHKQAFRWYKGISRFDTDKYHNNFTEDLVDNDVFAGVMEDNFHLGNENEFMSKTEIIEIIGQQSNLPRKTWNEIKSKLKSMGFVYNCKKKKNGKKGCFMNITTTLDNHQGYSGNI